MIDRDEDAVSFLTNKFGDNRRTSIVHSDFLSASLELLKKREKFELILADLGISSFHIDEASRGFSFDRDATLDMRMDRRQEKTAESILNNYSNEQLVNVLKDYGELRTREAQKLSESIIRNRPISSTAQISSLIKKVLSRRKKRMEPQVFQALRIEVNDELELLQKALPVWSELLATGGRIAIITFHSLEDRVVKQYLQSVSKNKYDSLFQLLNKKPIIADANEIVNNPRARSAKLRAAVKK